MARIPYRGKDHNIISVGPSKAYDFTTVQGALDDIENSPPNGAPSSTNPYLVTVAPGIYAENVTVTEAHNYCTIRGESKFGSIVRPSSGIAMVVDGVSAAASYISIESINLASADSVGLSLTSTSTAAATQQWNEIDISDCVLDGQQGGFRATGVTDGSSDASPIVRFGWNMARSHIYGAQLLGNLNATTIGNLFRVNDAGDSTWLATLSGTADNKVALQIVGDSTAPKSDSAWSSVSDIFETFGTQDIGGSPGSRRWTGILLGDNSTTIGPKATVTGPRIYIENSDAAANVGTDKGGGVTSASPVPEDDFILTGGSIECVQRTGATAAAEIWGIGSTFLSAGTFLKAYGTSIVITDELASSTVASLYADNGCFIEAKVFSDTATSVTGTGTVVAIPEVP